MQEDTTVVGRDASGFMLEGGENFPPIILWDEALRIAAPLLPKTLILSTFHPQPECCDSAVFPVLPTRLQPHSVHPPTCPDIEEQETLPQPPVQPPAVRRWIPPTSRLPD
eukprot:748510-Hanusia_phi.AAC.1